MDDILLKPTRHTPKVDFEFSRHRLSFEGELYPENASLFFTPLLDAVKGYLDLGGPDALLVRFQLSYMNSASTKMVFQLIGMLDKAAHAGRDVVLEFEHDPEDEMNREFAEDVADEFSGLVVKLAHKA